jgi:hypothetical protein
MAAAGSCLASTSGGEMVRRPSARQAVDPGESPHVAINLDDDGHRWPVAADGAGRAGGDRAAGGPVLSRSATVAAAHPVVSTKLLQDLRAAGCQTALEHCGTGMGAFTFLPRLRPDYLKIAGHIVQGLVGDPRRALASALTQAAMPGPSTIAVQVEGRRPPASAAWA